MSAKPKGWPWTVLDLSGAPASTAEVRRAYAKKLKTIDQAKDIAGFEALREAYETALARLEKKVRRAIKTTLPESASEPVLDEPAAPPMQAAGHKPLASDPSEASPPADAEKPATDPVAVAERLKASLAALSEKNILLSPSERAQQILETPEFQAPELVPLLRFGMADYVRSQLLWNHLNEPYLRFPGITTELILLLDARFGWLSDYNAYRRDFHGDEQLLEAMVQVAGIERFPQIASVEYFSMSGALIAHINRYRVVYFIGALTLARFVLALFT